jgi:hypothetical protein
VARAAARAAARRRAGCYAVARERAPRRARPSAALASSRRPRGASGRGRGGLLCSLQGGAPFARKGVNWGGLRIHTQHSENSATCRSSRLTT